MWHEYIRKIRSRERCKITCSESVPSCNDSRCAPQYAFGSFIITDENHSIFHTQRFDGSYSVFGLCTCRFGIVYFDLQKIIFKQTVYRAEHIFQCSDWLFISERTFRLKLGKRIFSDFFVRSTNSWIERFSVHHYIFFIFGSRDIKLYTIGSLFLGEKKSC